MSENRILPADELPELEDLNDALELDGKELCAVNGGNAGAASRAASACEQDMLLVQSIEDERDEWRAAFENLQTLATRARTLVTCKGEWRDRVPAITDVTNIDTLRAESAESRLAALQKSLPVKPLSAPLKNMPAGKRMNQDEDYA